MLRAMLGALALLHTTAALADDCEDAGRLGTMLGQIDQQCAKYELTDAGRKAMRGLSSKIAVLGGPVCVAKGKVAMLQDLQKISPDLDKLAASGNQRRFTEGLCEAIARYFEVMTMTGKSPTLFIRR